MRNKAKCQKKTVSPPDPSRVIAIRMVKVLGQNFMLPLAEGKDRVWPEGVG